jgi:tetratricopeptide (TPR) repeat protein
MGYSHRTCLTLAVTIVLVGVCAAQAPPVGEIPTKHVPVRTATEADKQHQEALRLYGLGILQEKKNRLIEAIRTLEEAQKLDPESAAIVRALIPIYLAVERIEDALSACERALKLNPNDYETGYLYSRQLRGLGRVKEAITILEKTTKCPDLKDRPDLKAQVWFDLAGVYEQERRWAESEQAFRVVTGILEKPEQLLESGNATKEDIATQSGETYERLGQVCLKADKPDRAVEAFELAQKKDPARASRLAFNLAQVFEGQGKLNEALEQLELYLRTEPQGVEVYERKIALQRRAGREHKVLPDLSAAAQRDPNNMALKMLLAKEFRRAGRRGEAEQVYKDLLAVTPGPEVYRALFDLCKESGRSGGPRALTMLDTAVRGASPDESGKKGNEGDASAVRSMLVACREDAELVRMMLEAARGRLAEPRSGKLAYTTRVLLATLAGRTKQLALAESLYRSCLDRPEGLRELESDVYSGLLQVLLLQHRGREVVELCREGLKTAQATNRVLFHQRMAWAYRELGDFKEALTAIESAIRDAGERELPMMRRARLGILSQAGKHDEAIAEGQKLIKDYPFGEELRDTRMALSSAYLEAGKYEQSEAQIQLVLDKDPNDAMANNNLGYQWADRNKNLDEAEKMIRKAIDLDKTQRNSGTSLGPDSDRDNAGYLDSLGWVLFRRGKLEVARQELQKAVSLPEGAEDPVVWDHLADVLFRLGKKEEAANAWKKAVTLYESGARPSDERLKEIREKLRLTP